MIGTEIYKRTPTYEEEAPTIRIHAPQWKLLLAFDGQRTLSEIALSVEATFAEVIPLTQKFLDNKWIAEEPITLEQYLKRTGAADIAALGAVVPPALVVHEPETDKPAAVAAPAPPLASGAASSPVAPPPLPTASIPVNPATSSVPTTVVSSDKVDAPKGVRTMKLSAVVDYLTSLVGNISLGQLLVYRVFLRVPPDLLLAEDIASVHLANDTSIIQGEKLQKSIAEAVGAVAKKTLPDSVYAFA